VLRRIFGHVEEAYQKGGINFSIVLHNLDCSPNITKANVKSEIEVQVAYVGEILFVTP